MRKMCKFRLKNSVQNIIIVCLLLSAAFLFLHTDLIRFDTLGHVISSVSPSANLADTAKTNVQMPLHIVSRTDTLCQAWLNETTSGEVFEDFGPPLLEAIGSATNAVSITEDEFCSALEQNGVYYDFTTTFPLPLFINLISVQNNAPQSFARAAFLSSSSGQTVLLYVWDAEHHRYIRWNTTVTSDSLSRAAAHHTGIPAEFAFLSGEAYSALSPYTLIPSERIVMPELVAAPSLQKHIQDDILTHLEFNVHSNSRYPESNGTEVILQGSRILRILPDGTIIYSGNMDDEISFLTVEHSGETASFRECVDAAWRVITTLSDGTTGDAAPYLLSARTEENGRTEILFGYAINGAPIAFPDDYAAKVEINGDTIVNFTLRLRSYTTSEKASTLLPALQAAAAVQSTSQQDLFPGYYDDGNAALPPCWLRK